ncbi:MAG: hypothetical protein NTV88_05370 [Candidatus Micrarchaeota archaeon]|nr:hypothetical protein [Candidatus Micrarchaeota archaeon]
MPKKKQNPQTPIYLVYDFEELCGVFSTLPLAREAAEEHLALVKNYTVKKAKQMKFGDVTFEVYRDDGERRWLYAMVAKTKHNNADLHRRKVVIYQYNMDQYYSMMKRFIDNGGNGKLISDGRK